MGQLVRLPPSVSNPARRRRTARGKGDASRPEHPLETLQRTAGNRATTALVQRRGDAATTAAETTALRPDATQDDLHAEYRRGREQYDAGLFDEAIATWTPVYAHPMTRANARLRAKLALNIGRANQRRGSATEAVTWYQEVVATPGVDPTDVATAREWIVEARRRSESTDDGGTGVGAALPPDAPQELLHARYIEGHGLYASGLFDEAAATWVPVYEHRNVDAEKRAQLALVIGHAHFHARRHDRAISWYQEAIQTEGADADAVATARDRIAQARRGSESDHGQVVGAPLDPDASQDVLHAQYLEGMALHRAGLFTEAIAKLVPVYEHPKVGDDKRPHLAYRIGTSHHHLLAFDTAGSWYREALIRGLPDIDAIATHRRLAQARDGKPPVDPMREDRPTIAQGWTGPHVRHLQSRLAAFGFDVVVDADFGPATAAKVREVQASNGLRPDGIVGPRTWMALS